MTLLLTFLLGMVCVSAALYAGARLFLHLDERAEQWPLLWATGLLLSVLIPLAGIALVLMPDWAPTPSFEILSLHEPLNSLGHSLGFIPDLEPTTAYSAEIVTLATASKFLAVIYLIGVALNLVKLAFGRVRIHRLIGLADPLGPWSGDDVLLSPAAQSPFAWTPFGQPQHSRIVIPESYTRQMSQDSLNDILTHERTHIERRDDECGLILRTLLCVCWISPFAHGLFGRWSQSTEIRCDMAVTDGRTPQMRKAYADTLLRALHIVAGRVVQYPAASFSTHRIRNEKMRITHIMKGTRPTYKRGRDKALLGLAATAITVVGMISISTTASAGDSAPQTTSAPDASKADKATKAPKAPKADKATKTDKSSKAHKASKALKVGKKHVSSAMVSGRLTSTFGPAADPFNKGKMRDHYGIDIAAPLGTPIYAPANGIITAATDLYDGKPAYGNVVVLQTDDGVQTVFAHLDGYTVRAGQSVTQGTQIATVGSSGKSTGPHVHIETYQNGTRLDPQGVWPLQGG